LPSTVFAIELYDGYDKSSFVHTVQPVLEKMRLEMVIGMPNEILDGHHRVLFKGLI